MGKGDKRSKRGKIWRGSNGKSRPKNSKLDSSKNSGKSGS
ncbi:MAG TPA: 30S ribosomal protein THX [Chitinophagales bacterium]|nr:30S ribosomal protein THX [Chitinophagales bacterium]